MTVYVHLFHGRTDPRQQMVDWGTDGPCFGPLEFVHWTYGTMRLGEVDGCLEFYEDLVYYDGWFYGDFYVSDSPEGQSPMPYDQTKTHCRHCGLKPSEHADLKCLFEPTNLT